MPVGSTIPAVLRRLLARAPMSPEKLTCAWQVAVGPAIARATRVTIDDAGTVTVVAVDQTWSRELSRNQSVLLRRLQELLGSGAAARIEVGTEGEVPRARRRSRGRDGAPCRAR